MVMRVYDLPSNINKKLPDELWLQIDEYSIFNIRNKINIKLNKHITKKIEFIKVLYFYREQFMQGNVDANNSVIIGVHFILLMNLLLPFL
jgi:hypothetical protein